MLGQHELKEKKNLFTSQLFDILPFAFCRDEDGKSTDLFGPYNMGNG